MAEIKIERLDAKAADAMFRSGAGRSAFDCEIPGSGDGLAAWRRAIRVYAYPVKGKRRFLIAIWDKRRRTSWGHRAMRSAIVEGAIVHTRGVATAARVATALLFRYQSRKEGR